MLLIIGSFLSGSVQLVQAKRMSFDTLTYTRPRASVNASTIVERRGIVHACACVSNDAAKMLFALLGASVGLPIWATHIA